MSNALLSEMSCGIAQPELINGVIVSVEKAMSMCECSARCVSVSAIPSSNDGLITGMIGLHGKVTGFATVNVAEQVAMRLVGGLLQDRFETVCPQVVDGAGELTNIIVGGIKTQLSGTPWTFNFMTTPSVIIGSGYQIAYGNGLEFMAATFEIQDEQSIMLQHRLLTVSLSLLKL